MSIFKKIWDALDPLPDETPVASELPQPTAKPEFYADITVILDRSSSMHSMQNDVVKGFNDYVVSMRETPGDNKWTMVQFDDPSSAHGANEEFPLVTYSQMGEREVPFLCLPKPVIQPPPVSGCSNPVITLVPPPPGSMVYRPRGGTALVDAMYKTVEGIDARLSGQYDRVQPVVMVITDGEENSSRKHSSDELRQLIARTQGLGFQYIYLGANQDSFGEARKYGIDTATPTYAHYTGSQLCAGATGTNNFVATGAGMQQAIGSGMVGVGALVSGSLYRYQQNQSSTGN